MNEEFVQPIEMKAKFQLGPLGNLNQVIKALGKTIRAMANGDLDSHTGARICNGLGIMRSCLETVAIEQIEDRLAKLEDPLADRASPDRYASGEGHLADLPMNRKS